MPVYVHRCEVCGAQISEFRSMKDSGLLPVHCDRPARRDYVSENQQIGMIDGETSGFYPKDFPLAGDPAHPTKRVVPSRNAWREYCKRNGLVDMT